MLKIKANKNQDFEYQSSNGKIELNNHIFESDILQISESKFHILKNNKSYNVEVISYQKESKTFQLKVNNSTLDLQIQDQLDQTIARMGIKDISVLKVSEIRSPMPGLILEIKVSADQEVEQGESLIILEAMKMENLIKSPIRGTIKSLTVKPGDTVEKNQILIEFKN